MQSSAYGKMPASSIVLFLLLAMFLCVFLRPDDLWADSRTRYLKQEGQKYYWGREVTRNLNKAFQLYLEAAKRGDREAQYIAGGMYFRGMGTEPNYARAFQLLHGAALKGKSTPESQKLLGEFFLIGHTVPQNYEEALKWYKKAANNGDREAQSELGYLYFAGRGIEQNFKKAFFWTEKAARQGLAVAQYSLGIMWYSGNGVDDADLINAYAWLSVAAANNYPDAIVVQNFLKTSLNREELVQAQNKATYLSNKSQKIIK